MLPLERHRLIVELLGQHGVMRVNEIGASDSGLQGNDSPRSERGWNAKGS
ncbi:L-fucose operon activator [Klebsiella pneumoniae]|uniref:L-fucose operon activator n=1 Tax=Klebsiella pneumoniae TaxID=573 RepID=A0A377X852_KLEPN|nr:L-fucose operon activator [Klebsiella pneumoniae]